MKECEWQGCFSMAINDDPSERFCDVCFYKRPLLNLLAIIHGDGGCYTGDHGIKKSAEDATQLVYKLREIELMHHAHPVTKEKTKTKIRSKLHDQG